jgi:hypothetical protein
MQLMKYDPATNKATPVEVKTFKFQFLSTFGNVTSTTVYGDVASYPPNPAAAPFMGKPVLSISYEVAYGPTPGGKVFPYLIIDNDTGVLTEGGLQEGPNPGYTCYAIITYLD